MMPKPRVTLENQQEVYDFYRGYRPNPKVANMGYMAMNAIFRPQVHFLDDAQESIAEMLPRGTRFVIAANHSSVNDQYVIAGMAHGERVLRPLKANTFIPSKAELFDETTTRHTLLRHGIDLMGAVPVFRASTSLSKDQAPTPEQVDLHAQAVQSLFDVSVERIEQGQNMAIFPEGTRNNEDPRKLQKIKQGIGNIVCAVSHNTPLAIVPVGISYGEGVDRQTTGPEVVISEPIMRQFEDPMHVLEVLEPRMQQVLDLAFDLTDSR